MDRRHGPCKYVHSAALLPLGPACDGLTVPQALGRVGRVLKVFGDGNLQVTVAGQLWTFSPSCLVAYRPQEDANLDVAERARENKSAGNRLGCTWGRGAPRLPLTPVCPQVPWGLLWTSCEPRRVMQSVPGAWWWRRRWVMWPEHWMCCGGTRNRRAQPPRSLPPPSSLPYLPVPADLAFPAGGYQEPGQDCSAGGYLPGPGGAGAAAAPGAGGRGREG